MKDMMEMDILGRLKGEDIPYFAAMINDITKFE